MGLVELGVITFTILMLFIGLCLGLVFTWCVIVVLVALDPEIEDKKITEVGPMVHQLSFMGMVAYNNFVSSTISYLLGESTFLFSWYVGSTGAAKRALLLLTLCLLAAANISYQADAVIWADSAYKCTLYPTFNKNVLPLSNAVRTGYDGAIPIAILSRRMASFYSLGWGYVLSQCGFGLLTDSAGAGAAVMASTFRALAAWEVSPAGTPIDLTEAADDFGTFVRSLYAPLVCLCGSMEPVWDFFTTAFDHHSFAEAVNYTVNTAVSLIRLAADWAEGAANAQTNSKRSLGAARPTFTPFFDSACNATGMWGAWADDVLQDLTNEVELTFGGSSFSVPRLSCAVTGTVCAVLAAADLLANSLVRADLLAADPEAAYTYIDFSVVLGRLLSLGSCLQAALSRLSGSAGCAVGSFVRSVAYALTGTAGVAKAAAVSIKKGEGAAPFLRRAWASGNFDASFAEWDGFDSCVGAFVASASPGLGCVVEQVLKFAGGSIQAGLLVAFAVGESANGTAGKSILAQVKGGAFDKPVKALNATLACLEASASSVLGGSAGCVVSAAAAFVYTVASGIIRLIDASLASANGGEPLGDSLDSQWNGGGEESFLSRADALGSCIASLVSSVSSGAGCALFRAWRVGTLLFSYTVSTAVTLLSAASDGRNAGGAFLSYYDSGAYSGMLTEELALAACLGDAIESESVTAACVVANTVKAAAYTADAIGYIGATAVRSETGGSPGFFFALADDWVGGGSPLLSSVGSAAALSRCAFGIGGLVSEDFGCFLGYTATGAVAWAWAALDASFRVGKGSHDGLTPGALVYLAWDSGNYSAPFDAVTGAGACLGGSISGWSSSAGCFVSSAVSGGTELVRGVFSVVIIAGESGFSGPGFADRMWSAWIRGNLTGFFDGLSGAVSCAGGVVSELGAPNAGCAVGSIGVASSNFLYDASAVGVAAATAILGSSNFAANATALVYRDIWGGVESFSSCAGATTSFLSQRLADFVSGALLFSFSSVRLPLQVSAGLGLQWSSGGPAIAMVRSWHEGGSFQFFYDSVAEMQVGTRGLLEPLSGPLGCTAGAAVGLVAPAVRGAFALSFALGSDPSEGGFPAALYSQWLTGGFSPSVSDAIDATAPCLGPVDLFLDPAQGCAGASTLRFAASLSRGLASAFVLGLAASSGAVEGGGDLLYSGWESGGLNASFVDLDSMLWCQSSALLGRVSPSLECLYPDVVSTAASLLYTALEFAAIAWSSGPNAAALSANALESLESTGRGLGLPFQKASALGSCAGSVLGIADDDLGCSAGSLFQAVSSAALATAELLAVVSHEASVGSDVGLALSGRWFSGYFDPPFTHAGAFFSCFGDFANGFVPGGGAVVSGIGNTALGYAHDTVGFFLLAYAAWVSGGGFGNSLQSRLDDDTMRRGRTQLIAFAVDLGGGPDGRWPVAACFAETVLVLGAETLNVAGQIVADAAKPAPNGSRYGEQFLASWDNGKYAPSMAAGEAVAPCLGMAGDSFFSGLGCVAEYAYLFAVGALEDAGAFAVVVTRYSVYGGGFESAFASSWNAGNMSHALSALGDLSECVGSSISARYSERSPQTLGDAVKCFPSKTISFIRSTVSFGVQVVVDVFFASDFEQNWYAGAYDFFFEDLDALFGCVSGLFALLSPDVGCSVQTALVLLDATAKDLVDFMLAFSTLR